jgi:DNA polymerase epsilon subunit 3
MPPRKSNVSAVSATGDEGSSLQAGKESTGSTNIEDLSLPRTVVGRLAKGVLPANTIIQKDAIMAITKASTLFVNYLSHNSHAHTLRTTRRTIYPADVFMGLRDSEFDFMLPRLEAELDRYNSVQTSKRNEYRKKVKEGTMGNTSHRKSTGDAPADAQMTGVDDGEPAAKRAKMEEGVAAGHHLRQDGMEEEEGDETVEEEEVGEEAGDDAGEGEEDEEGDEDEEEGGEDEDEDESREVGEDDDDTLAEESD